MAIVGALAVCAATAGCGGGGGKSTSNPPGSTKIAAATGGTVELAGGPTLQIPPGALAADTLVTITASTDPAPGGAVGTSYELGPDGTTFAQPVTITLPLPVGTTSAAVWTKSANDTVFHSLPTTISEGKASAQLSHFSFVVVGPVDLSGTWAGPLDWSGSWPDGRAVPGGTLMHARDVTQNVGEVTYALTNSTGSLGACTGTLSGSTLSVRCNVENLDGCTATYEPSGTLTAGTPSTWSNEYSFQWTGACPAAGMTIHTSGTLALQAAPNLNIAGTYAHQATWTNTGPGVPPISGQNTGTRVRSQEPGSSRVKSTIAITGGATSHCAGPIIGNAVYATCSGPNGQSTGTSTVNVSTSPLTISGVATTPLSGSSYTLSTSTWVETRGCISIAGTWRITSHCDASQVGLALVVTQAGCTASSTNPTNGQPISQMLVNDANVTFGECAGPVSGNTWSLTCGPCALTLVRS